MFQRRFLGASFLRIIVAQPSCPQLSSVSQGAMHCTSAASADSVEQPVHSESDSAEQPAKVPIIEVAFKNGMWWSIPMEMSLALYQKYEQGEDAGYTWDWGEQRTGSWVHQNEETSINRYVIDFSAMQQRNIDNGRLRTIRIVWVSCADVAPRWTGEIHT